MLFGDTLMMSLLDSQTVYLRVSARTTAEARELAFVSELISQADDGIRDDCVTGVQTCVLLISSRRRHTRSLCDWSSDVCSSDLKILPDVQKCPHDSSALYFNVWLGSTF